MRLADGGATKPSAMALSLTPQKKICMSGLRASEDRLIQALEPVEEAFEVGRRIVKVMLD